MSQKGFAPILIILILAALVGGYLYYQKQTKPIQTPLPKATAQTPKVSPNPTNENTNWKTYTNTKYGFSIQYPSDLTITSEGFSSPGLEWGIIWTNKSKEEIIKTGPGYGIGISIYNNAINKNGQKIVPENMDTLYVTNDLKRSERMQFDNRPARKFRESFSPDGGAVYYNILDGNRLIDLGGTSDDRNKYSLSSIDQILSTFKFTN